MADVDAGVVQPDPGNVPSGMGGPETDAAFLSSEGSSTPTLAVIEVLNVTPPDGDTIDVGQPIVFDVRSTVAFRRIMITFAFEAYGFTDLAFAQDPAVSSTFESAYGSSTITPVADGTFPFRYRFTCLRGVGWPSSPELIVYAFAQDGVEV